jgi:hypothetical protein
MVVMNESIVACAQKRRQQNKMKMTNNDCGGIRGNFKGLEYLT